MYTVRAYGAMLAGLRVTAYAEALHRAVRPGSIVLDIGTGIGYFAMLACRLGASRVYALEPADVIHVARQIAHQNGFGGRIQFIQKRSTEMELPERADVIISDLRDVLPLFEDHIASIADARERLLAPGGFLIPQRDFLWAAVVQSQSNYDGQVTPSTKLDPGFDMSPARHMAANQWQKVRLHDHELLTEPQLWATLDYNTVVQPNCGSKLDFAVSAEGTAHGIVVWFDTELCDRVTFSNRPGCPELIYGQAFFTFEQPVAVNREARISVLLEATLAGRDYAWRWETEFTDPSGRVTDSFKQSTLFGAPLAKDLLRKRADNFVPTLNTDGEIERFVLGLMEGRQPLREIAQALCNRFPQKFGDFGKSFDLVAEISARYSR